MMSGVIRGQNNSLEVLIILASGRIQNPLKHRGNEEAELFKKLPKAPELPKLLESNNRTNRN
jgi:hypothetical protein